MEFGIISILSIIIFIWLLAKGIGLALKLTWGAAKITAGVLMILSAPVLLVLLLFAGGLLLLIPLAMAALAVGILKRCI